ncbi:hypothetical protein [Nocardia australiensis]|uniref:hypothetical protein n=1 Tax=Nocardia australiensis TaxID=2887191 RepID=UPI001D132882|nr:hypothetical protein [Nocardia australiensis]
MTIYESSRSMTSSVTPEWAWRADRDEPAWQLSWLPKQLTREQALAGMQLQEILSRPDPASDPDAHAQAGALGITVQQALSLLHQRILDRRHS